MMDCRQKHYKTFRDRRTKKTGDKIVITVSDNGIGISIANHQ